MDNIPESEDKVSSQSTEGRPKIDYNGILSSITEGIFALDQQGLCVYCNLASLRMLGYSSEKEFLGKKLHSLLHFAHPDGRSYPVDECKILHASTSGIHISVNDEVFWRADGIPIPVSYSCYPQLVDGKLTGTVITFSDLSEQKLQQKKLESSEAKYRNIFKNANTGIIYVNEYGYTVSANQSFLSLIQFSLAELQMMHYSEFTNKEDFETEVLLRREMKEGKREEYKIEKRYRRKDGRIIWVSSCVSAFREQLSHPLFYVAVVHDITDRKEYEQKLLNSNNTKDKFFSIIAHDLRNPVGSLKIMSDLLNQDLQKGNISGVTEIAGIMDKQIGNTLSLLNDLLEWSRAQTENIAFSPTPVNVRDIFSERSDFLMIQAGNKNITIEYDTDSDLMVYADRQMLNTIMRNLITNAIKFSYEKSIIFLHAEERVGWVLISITDRGIGIPKVLLEKLFLPDSKFSTYGTKNESGTGLGLLLCKEFVERHGGRIWAESEEGQGTKLLFTLPIYRKN
ncbi:PAS domain S-box-containing protein [Arcticibacter tournemirensis]|uniref:histidine kinase n=1 Tax=Arcticibacter tournemirensis TaxID=699437 RepID=A0A5M9GYL4_9SPHI|nr:PAS domain-containing sensor histidine kinase [Arcticibacter tournemirensis]KAA8479726.1 PAS domain-containing sensor histidine kinase [Arcticibacter tournemirensis]TQM50245.1 PAS domain S-box-containing protein [Arcticibacter tournemirensis]